MWTGGIPHKIPHHVWDWLPSLFLQCCKLCFGGPGSQTVAPMARLDPRKGPRGWGRSDCQMVWSDFRCGPPGFKSKFSKQNILIIHNYQNKNTRKNRGKLGHTFKTEHKKCWGKLQKLTDAYIYSHLLFSPFSGKIFYQTCPPSSSSRAGRAIAINGPLVAEGPLLQLGPHRKHPHVQRRLHPPQPPAPLR